MIDRKNTNMDIEVVTEKVTNGHTGEEEEYNTERAAQEFAEFLAQALAHHRRTR